MRPGESTFRHAAASLLFLVASALAIACGESGGPSAPASAPTDSHSTSSSSTSSTTPSPTPSTSGLLLVPLATYEGSGQAVHPDGAVTPPGWGITTAHVVATPYPNGSARVENPSFYNVFGPTLWVTPGDSMNPIAMPKEKAHLSDPDMVYDPETRVLRVYFREASADSNMIYVIHSKDGTHWSEPRNVLSVPSHFAISPTVVRRGPGEWLMWSVNGGTAGCTAQATTVELRHSSDGLTWGAPETVRIGTAGMTPWHLDVEWIASRHEFWGVYNAKKPGSCMTGVLRFATSTDGVEWTEYPSPLIRAGVIPEFNDVVYRASVAYDSVTDAVTLMYSGARVDSSAYTWRVATEQIDLRSLMARISAPAPLPSSHDMIAGARRAAPELTNETAP